MDQLAGRPQYKAAIANYITINVVVITLVMMMFILFERRESSRRDNSRQLAALSTALDGTVKLRLKNNRAFRGMTSVTLAQIADITPAGGTFFDIDKQDGIADFVWIYAVDAQGAIDTKKQYGTDHGVALCNAEQIVTCARIVVRPGKADDITYAQGKTIRAVTVGGAWNHRFDTISR